MRDPEVSLNASSAAARVEGPEVPPPDARLLILSIVGMIYYLSKVSTIETVAISPNTQALRIS